MRFNKVGFSTVGLYSVLLGTIGSTVNWYGTMFPTVFTHVIVRGLGCVLGRLIGVSPPALQQLLTGWIERWHRSFLGNETLVLIFTSFNSVFFSLKKGPLIMIMKAGAVTADALWVTVSYCPVCQPLVVLPRGCVQTAQFPRQQSELEFCLFI